MNRIQKNRLARPPGTQGAELENQFVLRLPLVSVFFHLDIFLHFKSTICIIEYFLYCTRETLIKYSELYCV